MDRSNHVHNANAPGQTRQDASLRRVRKSQDKPIRDRTTQHSISYDACKGWATHIRFQYKHYFISKYRDLNNIQGYQKTLLCRHF